MNNDWNRSRFPSRRHTELTIKAAAPSAPLHRGRTELVQFVGSIVPITNCCTVFSQSHKNQTGEIYDLRFGGGSVKLWLRLKSKTCRLVCECRFTAGGIISLWQIVLIMQIRTFYVFCYAQETLGGFFLKKIFSPQNGFFKCNNYIRPWRGSNFQWALMENFGLG